jgi:hypothetical protein
MSFFFFCDEDDYLTSYGFIPCADRNTFFDHLNKGYLLFSHRTGRDIDNDFICDSDIGDAYNPPYALCTPEEDVRYDEQDCKPSWVILQEQETQELGVRELAKGRCEDFALLYYSLFRSIGLKPEDMELKLGYCDLPCPCKELVRKLEPCGFDYEKEMCFVPANLSFPTLGYKDIDGCDGVQGLPDDYRGRFKITVSGDGQGYFWVINQNFTGDNNSPVFRNLVLDSNYTNDDWWTNLNGVPYESIDMINGGPMIYESTDIGLKAKYGFEVSVDLEACEDNDTLLVYLGFEDEAGGPADLTYYLLTHGETRGVVHEGPLIGPVTYGYFIGNPACFDGATPRFSFDITPGTEGLILQDACRSFYANSGLDHSIEGLITACEKYLSYGRNSTTGMDVGLDVIPDIIAALGCSVE